MVFRSLTIEFPTGRTPTSTPFVNIREIPSSLSRFGWLILMALLVFESDVARGQIAATNSVQSVSLSSLAPRQRHKLRVSDKEVAAQIEKAGGELVADYGSFQFFDVDDVTAEAMKNRPGAQAEDRLSRIELN